MNMKNRFSLATVVASAAFAFTGCDDKVDPIDCEVNPTAAECQINCEANPTAAECLTDCEVDPNGPGCQVDCEANPTHEDCVTLDCVETPRAEGCEAHCPANPTADECTWYCEENPGAVPCLPTTGTAYPAPVITPKDGESCDETSTTADCVCTQTEQADVTKHAWNFRDTAAIIPDLDVTNTNGELTLVFNASLGNAATAAWQSWLYLDLNAEGGPAFLNLSDIEAYENGDWEIAFKRTEIRINSNNSNFGGSFKPTTPVRARSVALYSTSLENFSDGETGISSGTPSYDAFVDPVTCEITTFGQEYPKTAFNQWYTYDMATHSPQSERKIYGLYFGSPFHGIFWKIQIDNYNNGIFTLKACDADPNTFLCKVPV